ncbi:MAG: RNA polymerase sigma factor [bacterium]|nr:RNA polymerase sigma factor [bacterium]MDT8366094.1 RNA polymerase sigma factor [bacterium]
MDKTQFHSEYEQVSDQLFTFLLRSVGDRDLAADLLQDAAYRAYRSRRQFRGDSTFKTWIYRIAVNTMKNKWARAKRERNWFEGVRDLDTESSPTPEELFTGRESAMELSRVLMLLEEGYRVPFMLKHVDGLSYSEISEVLGIAVSAARVRVYRARHALRNLLREDMS